MRSLFLVLVLLLPQIAFADIYRCVENGKTKFQGLPCPGENSESNKLALPQSPHVERAPGGDAGSEFVPPSGSSAGWPGTSRDSFAKGFAKNCISKRQEDPFSKYMTQEQQKEYCACVTGKIMDSTTLDDFGKAFQSQDYERIRPKAQVAGEYCAQGLMKKWGSAKRKQSLKEGKI